MLSKTVGYTCMVQYF